MTFDLEWNPRLNQYMGVNCTVTGRRRRPLRVMNPVPMMEADETDSRSGVHFAKDEHEHDAHDVQQAASQASSIEETL